MAVLYALFCLCGLIMIFAMFSVMGCNKAGHMGMGGVHYNGPDRVCLHDSGQTAPKPYWGEIGVNHIEIGADPDCLLNLMIPKNWECWLEGPNKAHEYHMMDQAGNLIMELPQPLCRPKSTGGTQVGESTPYPMPLDIKIPAQVGGQLPPGYPGATAGALGTGVPAPNTVPQTAPRHSTKRGHNPTWKAEPQPKADNSFDRDMSGPPAVPAPEK